MSKTPSTPPDEELTPNGQRDALLQREDPVASPGRPARTIRHGKNPPGRRDSARPPPPLKGAEGDQDI